MFFIIFHETDNTYIELLFHNQKEKLVNENDINLHEQQLNYKNGKSISNQQVIDQEKELETYREKIHIQEK